MPPDSPLVGAELVELLTGGLEQPQPPQVPAGGGKEKMGRKGAGAEGAGLRTLLSC